MPDDGLAIKDPVLKRCHRSGRWPTLNSIKQRKRSIWKPNIHRTAVIGCGTDLYSGRWATVKKSDAKWKTNFEHSTNDQIRYGRVTIMNHYHHHHHYRSVLSSRTSPSDRCSPPLLWQITIKNTLQHSRSEKARGKLPSQDILAGRITKEFHKNEQGNRSQNTIKQKNHSIIHQGRIRNKCRMTQRPQWITMVGRLSKIMKRPVSKPREQLNT